MSGDHPLSFIVPESVRPDSVMPDSVMPESFGSESVGTNSDEPEPPNPQAEIRTQMLTRFEQWLDAALSAEPPPPGVPEELLNQAKAIAAGNQPAAETDLFTLFSALTALTGEIRLQGRAFKLLTDLLSPLAETPATLARLEESLDNTDSGDPGVSIDQVCAIMLDLYDRLQRGLQTCDDGIQSLIARTRRGGWRRLFQDRESDSAAIASVQAIRDANALMLARLQAAMQEWGVQRIGKAGEPFDPDCMTAVDVRAVDHVSPGTVLIVQRSGYAVNGIVKTTAQVTVSKQG